MYGKCECGSALRVEDYYLTCDEPTCRFCWQVVDIGWYVVSVWPSGKVSLVTETFWMSEHGDAANAKAADKLAYMQKCQLTGKASIYGTVTAGTDLYMRRAQRAR